MRPAPSPGRPPDSVISMWARSASRRTASGNERSSVFMTKANTSPPSPAAEAVPQLQRGVDLERRGLLVVQRAAAPEVAPALLHRRAFSDDPPRGRSPSRTFWMSSSLMPPAMRAVSSVRPALRASARARCRQYSARPVGRAERGKISRSPTVRLRGRPVSPAREGDWYAGAKPRRSPESTEVEHGRTASLDLKTSEQRCTKARSLPS